RRHDGEAGTSSAPGLSLTVLGCDGSWVGPGGAGSSYLVRSASTVLVLDCGPGSFARLQLAGDPAHLDAVVLSHHHPDHWTDLFALATHARLVLERQVDVYAPADLPDRTGLVREPALRWHAVTAGDEVRIGDARCGFHRTEHVAETLAVRVDASGRALGYSADSGPGWSLGELGTGLDLALCEATYTAESEGTADHMSGRQAGAQARTAAASRLMVTHRWPTVAASAVGSEAAAAFGRPVEQAAMGRTVVV
ncbi:MAG TPA: MBL fold metallo-hydrolase, partial [Acidimicrobiales bacterium]|nr:MBL fold metallo-hydrolase [Acidimicrobiales bacterium]